jgi:hypothetical protein
MAVAAVIRSKSLMTFREARLSLHAAFCSSASAPISDSHLETRWGRINDGEKPWVTGCLRLIAITNGSSGTQICWAASSRSAARACRSHSCLPGLAEGMSAEEIAQTYAPFPQEAIPEIMKVAAELLDSGHVAA